MMTMLKALKRESNKTFTENGAVTHVSTYSDCLDLFATVGALRKASATCLQQSVHSERHPSRRSWTDSSVHTQRMRTKP